MKKKSNGGSKLITFLLVLVILILAGLLIYMQYGERILSRFQFGENGPSFIGAEGSGYNSESGAEESAENAGETVAEEVENAEETVPEEPEPVPEEPPEPVPEVPEEVPAPDYNALRTLPDGLSLNKYDITVRVLGEVTALQAGGGSGSYSWASQNSAVASVDQDGRVTANGNGTTNILVTDGQNKAVCIVRVLSGNGNTGSTGNELNRTDFTRKVSEGPYQLSISGVSEGISWRSTRPSVAEVSDSGLVTPLSPGSTTIIASWGDQSRVCIVRVPNE